MESYFTPKINNQAKIFYRRMSNQPKANFTRVYFDFTSYNKTLCYNYVNWLSFTQLPGKELMFTYPNLTANKYYFE